MIDWLSYIQIFGLVVLDKRKRTVVTRQDAVCASLNIDSKWVFVISEVLAQVFVVIAVIVGVANGTANGLSGVAVVAP